MKINVTRKEYQTLVEMLLVADWVITGHEEEREATKPYMADDQPVAARFRGALSAPSKLF